MSGYEIAEAAIATQRIPPHRHGTGHPRHVPALCPYPPLNALAQTIAAGALAGFASMGIAFFGTARLSQTWLTRLVSFAAGLMLAIALLDLLPEALEGGMAPDDLFAVLLVALLALFALDVKLHAGCRHGAEIGRA